jgi:hypothetical protein
MPHADEQPEQKQRNQRRAQGQSHSPSPGETVSLSASAMAGLDPDIHAFRERMDARVKPAHDTASFKLA